MRLFVAITIPEATKLKIAKLQKELHSPFLIGNWVRHENFHITLKFLCSVPETALPQLEEILEEFTRALQTFSVNLSEIEIVPTLADPKTIWLSGASEQLTRLAKALETALDPLAFSPDRESFVGHVTLARLKRGRIKPDWLEVKVAQFKPQEVTVKKITLYQSFSKPTGPEYKVIKHFRFNA